MPNEEQSLIGKTKKWARWSIVIAVNAAILLAVGVSTIRESYQGWKVDQEIRDLQLQVQQLEGKKLHISEMIDTLHSSENLDLEARSRLGMQKPGERVVILKGFSASTGTASQDIATQASENNTERSNPEKWFAYFITHKSP